MHLAYLIKFQHGIFIGCYFAKYNMQTYFLQIRCDVTAKVHNQPFRYRAYINNELFAERTWIWTNCYLEESFQIQATPGVYPIRFETVDDSNGRIKVRNYRVITGPGQIIMYQGEPSLEISDAST
jgi:hypothetical protein